MMLFNKRSGFRILNETYTMKSEIIFFQYKIFLMVSMRPDARWASDFDFLINGMIFSSRSQHFLEPVEIHGFV